MISQSSMSYNRVRRRLQVKVCGTTEPAELRMLDRAGVDYAGLWFNMPGGKYSLDRKRFLELVRMPLGHVRRVGVTTENDPHVIAKFIQGSEISGIQLHGFHLPKTVQSIKRRLDDGIELFKVLHVQRGECLEKPLLRQYAGCGADVFIVDSFVSRQRPGSTGERVPPSAVAEVTHVLGTERLFLAGGIDDAAIKSLRSSAPLRGVDIDSGSRVLCRIDTRRVHAIVAAAQASDG